MVLDCSLNPSRIASTLPNVTDSSKTEIGPDHHSHEASLEFKPRQHQLLTQEAPFFEPGNQVRPLKLRTEVTNPLLTGLTL